MLYLLSVESSTDVSKLIIYVGLIILLGLLFGRLAEMVKVPAITGYLIAGLFLGPILKIVDIESIRSISFLSDIALGFIAFQVGNELWLGKLKKSGMKIVVITIVQALLTTLVVTLLAMIFIDLSVALILGAIAAATAPAPIMIIVKKYRTKGELTDTVLPVVGLDDAVGVIMFGILLSIGMSLMGTSTGSLTFAEAMKEPMLELGTSILLGAVIGIVAGLAIKTISPDKERQEKNLIVVTVTVLITTGASLYLGASPILTPMIAGAIVTNMINKDCYVLEEKTIRFFVPPIMIAFFTIAGASLQFDVILAAGAVGIMYIVGRTFGKIFGAYAGTALMKSSPNVRKFLGMTLLPQSGVAIGLSIAAYNAISPINMDFALTIQNVVLAAVLVFELVAPLLVKLAFEKSGESQDYNESQEKETIHKRKLANSHS
ncbi:cation:proton antiporter [Mycoplasmatota bacterium]|nr:cation:proton antiporter [Mycoplasmatota bacterium]